MAGDVPDDEMGAAGPEADVEPGDLVSPFIFVAEGEAEPQEWMAAHPGWVKFPATMVPRAAASDTEPPAPLAGPERPSRRFPGASPWDVPEGMRKPGEGAPDGLPASPEPLHQAEFAAIYDHASRLIGAPLLAPPEDGATPRPEADRGAGKVA